MANLRPLICHGSDAGRREIVRNGEAGNGQNPSSQLVGAASDQGAPNQTAEVGHRSAMMVGI